MGNVGYCVVVGNGNCSMTKQWGETCWKAGSWPMLRQSVELRLCSRMSGALGPLVLSILC